jgi:hypothetical protein
MSTHRFVEGIVETAAAVDTSDPGRYHAWVVRYDRRAMTVDLTTHLEPRA